MEARDIIIFLCCKYKGQWKDVLDALRAREDINPSEVERVVKGLRCNVVTIMDEDYPEILRHVIQPPFALFYRGDLRLISNHKRCITIVGSREPTDYARTYSETIASDCARNGATIVSGLARGIDTAAAVGALPYGKAVAILGNGFNHYYPPENSHLQREIASKGLLLSEYPPFVGPSSEHFPCRNRLLAALSGVTFVGEAGPRSGTLITAGFALGFNRDLAALPFRAGEGKLNNELIKDGATPVETGDDLLFLAGISGPSKKEKIED